MNQLKFLLLAVILLQNCISLSYADKYEPIGGDSVLLEFPKKGVFAGKIMSPFDKNQKIEFNEILIGQSRNLIIEIGEEYNQTILTEFDEKKNALVQDKSSALLYMEPPSKKIFNDLDRYLSDDDLGIKSLDFQDEIFVIHLSNSMGYVILQKESASSNRYKKTIVPIDSIHYLADIRWVERNKLTWNLKKGLFYAGYIITIPLDAITGIFQVVFYFSAGGAAK